MRRGLLVFLFLSACGSDATSTIDAAVNPIDECAAGTHDCDAHATCTDAEPGFSCACNPGYDGDGRTCTFVGCSANPCMNGGTCVEEVGSVTCTCPTGFSGASCETNVDDCAGGPCRNGGTCTDAVNAFSCACAAGFSGAQCIQSARPLVSVYDNTSYLVKADGTLWNWGSPSGAAGGYSGVATEVGGNDWTYVYAGGTSTCGLRGTGELWCWGDNSAGQLGNGNTTTVLAPARSGTALWLDVALSDSVFEFACGVQSDGSLWCWGYDTDGQLGIGATPIVTHHTPQRVGTETDWAQVTVGDRHACAVKTGGALWCWGFNSQGQVGVTDTADKTTPVQVGVATDWIEVRARYNRTCARKTTGRLYCWGQSFQGSTMSSTPGPIGSATWRRISTGGSHFCGTQTNNSIWCWGFDNSTGKIGVGAFGDSLVPMQIGSATDWLSASAGATHSCGVRAPDQPWCWGSNQLGEIGLGQTGFKTVPTSSGTWSAIDASPLAAHTCGLATNGTISCWGSNQYAQLGDGALLPRQVPSQVGVATNWTTISSGGMSTCALTTAGTLYCWGCRDYSVASCTGLYGGLTTGSAPTQVGVATTWTALTGGGGFQCGLQSDGSLHCWGTNSSSQLGDGTTSERLDPVPIGGVSPAWIRVDGGRYHACGVRTDTTNRTLWCWGANTNGQLGNNSTNTLATPTQIGGVDWNEVSAGNLHSCGLRGTGTLWCWGENGSRQLGDSTQTDRLVPTQIGSATDWTKVDAGTDHTCGIRAPGTLWCWGAAGWGQLGVGDLTFRATPTQVGSDSDWIDVSAGDGYTCGRRSGGASHCWGVNSQGALGHDSAWRTTPSMVQ